MASKTTSRASRTLSWASKTPPRASKTAPKASKTPPRASKMRPRHPPRAPRIVFFTMCFNIFHFPGPSWGHLAQHGRQNAFSRLQNDFKIPPRASKIPHVPPTAWPSTKGGLAVVRPRRASSIRQTTLVSHGRVQDRALVSSSSKILPKEGLDQAPRLPPTPPLSAHLRWKKLMVFLCFFNVF